MGDGQCAPCSECHYCHDGIDGTCGGCGTGHPTVEDRSTYVGDSKMREMYQCGELDEEIDIDALRNGVMGELRKAGMSESDIADIAKGWDFSDLNSYSAKTVTSKAMEDEFIAAENAKEKENSYSAKSLISKAMGDDMSEYRKIIQQELDEEGDTETDAEMEAQLKVIAQLANEKTSSAKTYYAKALGDNKSKYSDVSAAKHGGNYGLGHRGYNDLYSAKSVAPMEDSKSKSVSSAKSSVSTVDDADAEEKENYKRLIRKQLDEENEDETDEEMDANVKVVMQLAREAAAKKGSMNVASAKSVISAVKGDADTDIESKVIAALRNAGKANPEGMSESDIAIKIMEGLDGLVNAGEV